MSSSCGENQFAGENRKSQMVVSVDLDDTNLKVSENNQDAHSGKTKSASNVSDINSSSGADGIVHQYHEMSKRKTPRVGTLFISNDRPDGQSKPLSLGAKPRTVILSSSTAVIASGEANAENSGLEKYNKYMKTHARFQTAAFQNLEFRKIVGQEDNSNDINVKRKLDERKLTSRPPVVGQASSSSNDSGSSALDHHSPSLDSDSNSCDDVPKQYSSVKDTSSAYFNNFNTDQQKVHIISNREDYISEIPPEGSSEQESIASQPDLQTDLPRIPSPSSVSSVASISVRPLEWDSGADVGYYQSYPPDSPDPDSKLSTLERIALARGSAALLTRSDPEGTTEQSSKFVGTSLPKAPKRKNLIKDRVRTPMAESTPFSFNVTSTPQTAKVFLSASEEDISSINEQKIFFPGNIAQSSQITAKSKNSDNSQQSATHYPLFPELLQEKENTMQGDQVVLRDDKVSQFFPQGVDFVSNSLSPKKSGGDVNKPSQVRHVSAPGPNVHASAKENSSEMAPKIKKLSCSMELLHVKSDLNEREQPYTLPRSQSHSNIVNENNTNLINSLPKSLIFRNFYPAKSVSSSSVSTVVQKRKESPNVISKLVQTSCFQQSVGIQASDDIGSGTRDSLKLSSCAPNPNEERSSYFGPISSENTDAENCGSFERVGHQFVLSHVHNGTPCYGAHKKISSACDNIQQNIAGQKSQTIPRDRCAVQINDSVNEFQKAMEHCNTLESIESCARSCQNMWATRRESMGVEDRVNSFEYLPGHVFENTGMKVIDSQGTGTSSVSLNRNESSRNEYSDGTDKLWDTSASSTLLRDIERGVNLMSNFVRTSNVNDSHLKQKLVKKVVEKLLRTEYSEDKLWSENLVKVLPWIPPELNSKVNVYSGRETRRSHNKEVQLNDVSTSEKSSSQVSSECFQTQNTFANQCKSSTETAEKCIGTVLPWIPPELNSKVNVYSGRETRRSHNKEVQLNDVSTSEKSSSQVSSECFQTQNTFANQCKSSTETAEKCIGTDQTLISNKQTTYEVKRPSVHSSSDTNIESGSTSVKPKSTAEESTQFSNQFQSAKLPRHKIQQSPNYVRGSFNSSSNTNSTTDRSNSVDWRVPVTKAEKLFEEKRKKRERISVDRERNNKASAGLLEFLNLERENQLFWIKSEIDHLSNLKRLLEKQEQLKKSLTRVKKARTRSAHTVVNKPKYSSGTSCPGRGDYQYSEVPGKSSDIVNKNNDKITKKSSGWTSHHYFSSAENELKFSPKVKEKVSGNVNVIPNELSRKLNKIHLSKSLPRSHVVESLIEKDRKESFASLNNDYDDKGDDDNDDEVEINLHKRKTVGTETTDTVGVQTSKSVQKLPVIKPQWYKNHKKSMKKESLCQCKKADSCKYCQDTTNKEKYNKKSVAYYITFDKSSLQGNSKSQEINLVDHQMYEPKNKSSARRSKSNVETIDKYSSCDSQASEDQKENYEPNFEMKTKHKRPTLQDYLLKNRSDYVSRAEYRRRCVAELAYLRELRDKSKRHLITMAPESSDYSQSSTPRDLPPPPLAVKRVFSQRTMRRQTERKYRQLAEVKSRQLDMKRKEAYRTNRLMAEVYTKKLQRRTLKGEVNLSNSVSVISSI